MRGMKQLQKYLEGRKKGDFAKDIGISPSFLSQILSNRRKPSLKLALAIDKATDGEVPASSWVEDATQ